MERALVQRVLTALVLAPLVIAAILLLDSRYFGLVLLPVIALAAWEWADLAGLQSRAGWLAYTLLVAVLTFVAGWAIETGVDLFPLLLVALIFWPWAAWVVWRFPSLAPGIGHAVPMLVLGLPVLIVPWVALVLLHRQPEQGPAWVVVLMLVIWGADVAAYFSGRRWGRRKLAPTVSPGKSWAGFWGGLVAVALVMMLFSWWLGVGPAQMLLLVLLGLVTGVISVLGDLFESVLKRSRGVKDSGSLLPGHGGILDRIDSMLSAGPVFALGVLAWFGRGGIT